MSLTPTRDVRLIGQQRLGAQHFQHLLGIGLPIGRAMQVAARFEARGQLGDQGRLKQAALVVAFFVPGVREKDVHAVQAALRQHMVNHLYRIVLHDADVGEALRVNAHQQRAYAGRMHLTAQKIVAWPHRGNVCRGLPHAKANFQDCRRRTPTYCYKINSFSLVR